jgi:hypothetical protein
MKLTVDARFAASPFLEKIHAAAVNHSKTLCFITS